MWKGNRRTGCCGALPPCVFLQMTEERDKLCNASESEQISALNAADLQHKDWVAQGVWSCKSVCMCAFALPLEVKHPSVFLFRFSPQPFLQLTSFKVWMSLGNSHPVKMWRTETQDLFRTSRKSSLCQLRPTQKQRTVVSPRSEARNQSVTSSLMKLFPSLAGHQMNLIITLQSRRRGNRGMVGWGSSDMWLAI